MIHSYADLRKQDYQFVQEILRGNRAPWNTLYTNAYGTVLRCAASADYDHLLCVSDYREAADEAFSLCTQRLEHYLGLSRFAYWVGGYARNLIRNRRRRELTRINKQNQLLQGLAVDMWGCDPLIILMRAERDQSLRYAFLDLTPIEQKILWKRVVCKMSVKRVAQELDISKVDVAIRYKAALHQLKTRFIHHYYVPTIPTNKCRDENNAVRKHS